MALDLSLKITADGSQAKQELASVESGVKKVEDASTKGSASVSKAFQAVTGESGKLNQATEKLNATTKTYAGVTLTAANSTGLSGKALDDYYRSLIKSDFAAADAAAAQKVLATETTAAGGAFKIAGVSVVSLTGLLTAAGGVLLGLGALVAKSTLFFIEHAESQQDVRDAVKETTTAWEASQYVIGQAAVGNVKAGNSIRGLNLLLAAGSVILAKYVRDANYLIETGLRWIGMESLLEQTVNQGAASQRDYVKELQRAADTMPVLTKAGREQYDAAKKLGASTQELTDKFGLNALQQQLLAEEDRKAAEATREHARISKEAAAERARHDKEVADIIVANYEATRKAGQAYYDIIRDATLNGTEGMKLRGEVSLAVLNREINKWLELRATIDSVAAHVVNGVGNLTLPGSIDIGTNGANLMPTMPKGIWASIFGSSADFGKQLAGTIMGALQGGGNVVEAAGSMIGSGLMGGLAKTITSGGGLAISGALGGALNAVLPGVGALLGPLAGEVVKFFGGLFNRNKGRDIVEDFVKGFGGFDGLHQQLNGLGADGERLWIMLTQGVGQNNPEQAKAAINAVTAALEANRQKQQETAQAAVNTAQAVVDTQAKVIDEIKGRLGSLDQEYNRLFATIQNEAPEEVMGIVEANTRAQLERIAEVRKGVQEELDIAQKKQEENLSRLAAAMEELNKTLGKLTAHPWDIDVNVNQNGQPPNPDDFGGGGESPDQAHTGGYLWGGRVMTAYHRGGRVADEFPILAQSGEFMMNRSAVGRYGLDFMRSVNSGSFSGGGAPVSISVTFAQPVIANDHTSMAKFGDFIAEATVQGLRRRGVKLPTS